MGRLKGAPCTVALAPSIFMTGEGETPAVHKTGAPSICFPATMTP